MREFVGEGVNVGRGRSCEDEVRKFVTAMSNPPAEMGATEIR